MTEQDDTLAAGSHPWPSRRLRLASFVLVLLVYPAVLWGALEAWNHSHTRVDDWLPERFQETRDLIAVVERFGSDELLMISWPGAQLEDPGVQLLAERLRRGDSGEPVYFDQLWTAAEIRDALTGEPLWLSEAQAAARMRGWILGESGRTAVIARVSDAGTEDRHAAVAQVRRLAQAVTGLDADDIHIAGPTIESVFIDELNRQSLLELNGLSLLTCLLLLLLCIRQFVFAVLIFAIAIYSQQLAMAAIHYSGGHMDSVVMMTANLTMVLSVSACIHMFGYYRKQAALGVSGAGRAALQEAFWPTVWAALTTACGLASLLVSDITPVFSFGLYGAIVAPLATLLSLWFLALALPSRRVPSRLLSTRPYEAQPSWPDAAGDQPRPSLAMRYWPLVFVIAAVLLAGGARGLPQLQANVGIHNLLARDSKLLQDYRWLESQIGPIVPIEVVLFIPRDPQRSLLDELSVVAGLQRALGDTAAVGQTISALNFLPRLPPQAGQRSVGQIAKSRVLQRRLEEASPDLVSWGMLSQDSGGHHWRITAKVAGSVDHDYEQVLNQLKEAAGRVTAGSGIEAANVLVSGGVPVAVRTQRRLLVDLASSFLLAIVLIYLALTLLLSNPLAGLLALLPNLLPAVIVFGIMGAWGIKAEIGGVMTASVVLGIAIDDALHLLHQFRRLTATGLDRAAATIQAYRRCRTAVLQTSLIIGGGMSVFAFSSFVPVSRFAWLMVLLLAVALVANLVLLPAILYSPLGRLFHRPPPVENWARSHFG